MEYSNIFLWKSMGFMVCDCSDGVFYRKNIFRCHYYFIPIVGFQHSFLFHYLINFVAGGFLTVVIHLP